MYVEEVSDVAFNDVNLQKNTLQIIKHFIFIWQIFNHILFISYLDFK